LDQSEGRNSQATLDVQTGLHHGETVLTAAATTIDCSFRNSSDRMVILRCCGPEQFFLERVVFPFELLPFRCPAASEVEIWTHGLGGPELMEALRAEQLLSDPTGSTSQSHVAKSPWLAAT
jgi:hypothetical protein